MTRTNAAMRDLLEGVDGDALPPLPPELEALLDQRLIAEGDALLLAAPSGRDHPPPDSFPDVTGYEAFVNHVHIDDHLAEGTSLDARSLLRYGLAFARRLEELLREQGRPAEIVVSVDEMTASVRFYVRRPGEPYLAEDIEGYRDEAILVLDVDPAA